MFDGDWNLVLAAYNGGPGRVSRAMKRSGVDDFWKLSATSKYLPQGNARVRAAHPGGDDHRPEPRAVRLRDGRPPSRSATRRSRCRRRSTCAASPSGPARRWTRSRQLNPELRRWTTPVKYPNYEVKVPAGTADKLTAKLAEASPADFSAFKWYTAKKGETLLTVARQFGVSRTDVAEANNLIAQVASASRPGADHPAPAGDDPRGPHRARRAVGRRVAQHRRTGCRRRPVTAGHAVVRRHLQGQAGRHPLLDRPALRHDGREDQELEPALEQSHRARHAAEDHDLAPDRSERPPVKTAARRQYAAGKPSSPLAGTTTDSSPLRTGYRPLVPGYRLLLTSELQRFRDVIECDVWRLTQIGNRP